MSTTEPDRGSSLSIGGRIGNNPAPTICGAQGRTENETVTPNETCVECGSQVGLDAHDIVTCQNWHFQSAIGPATVVQRDAMDRYVVAASMYGNALLAIARAAHLAGRHRGVLGPIADSSCRGDGEGSGRTRGPTNRRCCHGCRGREA